MIDQTTKTVLDNGLTVICLKKNSTPIISAQVWYKTGSVNECDGIRGISHFLEHMMFRGSQNIGPEEHAHKINDVGGHSNAFTAEDITAYLNSVPRDFLDMVLTLEAERMVNLKLDSSILQTERKVIIEEYHTHMNNPVSKAFLEFRGDFFADHPYAIGPLGRLSDIEHITPANCRDYYSNWYTPNNAVLVIVGDFSSNDEVVESVDHHFGAIASRPLPPGPPQVSLTHRSQHTKRHIEFDVPLLLMGFSGPPSGHSDALPLEVLQTVLSQGESSRLYRELVQKHSIAVMAQGMNLGLKRAGMSMFFTAFTPDISARTVEKAVDTEIARISREGILPAELQKVKNSMLSSKIFEMFSAEQLCQRIGFSEALEGDYRLWEKRLETLQKLDVDQLVTVAKRYWNDSNKHVLHLTPKKIKIVPYILGLVRRFLPVGRR